MAVAPATATPIPNPTIPCSQRGVLKTLSLPGETEEKWKHNEEAGVQGVRGTQVLLKRLIVVSTSICRVVK